MKSKLLLLTILFAGILKAQEPYRQLLITEAITFNWPDNYFEITNMGDKAINLKEFKFGAVGTVPANLDSIGGWATTTKFTLPDFALQPGKSFVISPAYDFAVEQYALNPYLPGANERPMKLDIYGVSNLLVHYRENFGDATDSVDLVREATVRLWGGNTCVFLEHHFAEGDSAVVDQFNGVNDGFDRGGRDVAGVTLATNRGPCMRKFKIKNGNLNFADARGVGADDSEWIALPYATTNEWRKTWWTVGNHGNYVLDANTLESDVIAVDFAIKKLTVPWGISRLDGIMENMKKKPGVAWNYILNANKEDSLYRSVRTGDKLAVYVCGNELTADTFDIVVSAPTSGTNIVATIDHQNPDDGIVRPITWNTQNGKLNWPRVTAHANGIDTITGSHNGLSYAFRSDSLLKYLDKPASANWKLVPVDGVKRPDLKNGDKLSVTAQSGAVKDYFIQVQPYAPDQNANLSAITWPDIPGWIYGWKGDTIPGFNAFSFNYTVTVPLEVNGIPALVAKTNNLNTKVVVKRAVSLSGSKADRTISFVVTAEDGISTLTYNVELIKEKDPDKVQPYFAEPFMSEFIMDEISSTGHVEIYNPGNQPIDLSNYMFTKAVGSDPNAQIASTMAATELDWDRRFRKYVPGYIWVNLGQWLATPGILMPDNNVNPILQPGETFVMSAISDRVNQDEIESYWTEELGLIPWPPIWATDINFLYYTVIPSLSSPWGPDYTVKDRYTGGDDRNTNVAGKTPDRAWFMFKILNDSVQRGLKPANNPKDYKLMEAFGMADGTSWNVAGNLLTGQWITIIRKPEIYKPNPVIQASNGTSKDNSEWIFKDTKYWNDYPLESIPGLQKRRNVVNNLGIHNMIEPTHYKSTVTSIVYKVSDGYSLSEKIFGMKTGTSVGTFLSNIIKANEKQTLKVKSVANGSVLADAAMLNMNDTLVVLSADSTNTTKYLLSVTDFGLSSNAVLTSTRYVVTIESQPKSVGEESEAGAGTIQGFDYGTSLNTIVKNITVPPGATMDIIDGNGAYVPLIAMNFDTAYVNVTVNSNIYIYVLAEDGLTSIVYKLLPTTSSNNAFILSDIYSVVQKDLLVQFVPRGTSVQTFFSYVVASEGATMKLVDKMGLERIDGTVKDDDKVVVTSPNGLVQKVYFLSMLSEQYVPSTTYLAYVLSNIYTVDQITYNIVGPTGSTLLSDFYSHITPSLGASAVVVDNKDVVRTTGDLNDGDKLKVTSADGKIVVMYDLKLNLTSANKNGEGQIQVYPNPTTGNVNIQGLVQGTRVQVFNQIGVLISNLNAERSLETITLENQPAGMYLFVLTKNDKILGQYKVIRK